MITQDTYSTDGALPNGSFLIKNRKDLKSAIHLVGKSGTYSTSTVKAHIISRAKALSLEDELPDEWKKESPKNMSQEITANLTFEGDLLKPTILQEEAGAKPGIMRVRVPFYVSNSLTQAKGFKHPIYFGEKVLPALVQEANNTISSNKQKITVYARHNHATSSNDLPVGHVIGVEQEGNIGYATLELADVVPHGVNLQKLLNADMINSVSLRSAKFEVRSGKVNGQQALVCEKLNLSGIDFAPDGPAQDTYGIQILNEDAIVSEEEIDQPKSTLRRNTKLEKITLEAVRAEAPEVVEEIEAPLQAELAKVRKEIAVLVQERDARELGDFLTSVAAECPDPAAVHKSLTELVQEKGIKTSVEAYAVITPILLDAMKTMRNQTVKTPEKTAAEKLQELFAPVATGNGVVVDEQITQEVDMSRVLSSGLVLPEDL